MSDLTYKKCDTNSDLKCLKSWLSLVKKKPVSSIFCRPIYHFEFNGIDEKCYE